MKNHFDSEIKLRKITYSVDSQGFPTESVTETAVYADTNSVKRSDFYSAEANGHKVSLTFTVNVCDYSDQQEIKYDNKIYTVVRSYQTDLDHIELICERKDG